MEKSFKLSCKQDVLNLARDKEYQDALWGAYDFSTYGNGRPQLSILSHDGYDIQESDVEFKITRRNALNKSMLQTDTDVYAAFTAETLDRKIWAARASLEARYNELLDKADEVQLELLYLMMLMRLRKRCDIQPVQHTSNKWVRQDVPGGREYSCERSNMVYKMFYRVYKDTEWNRTTQREEFTGKCSLMWYVDTQEPYHDGVHEIAGQDKNFRSEEEMRKYLDGRIKAFDKYFQEISPPIPDEFLDTFTYAGQLLPGYKAQKEGDNG